MPQQVHDTVPREESSIAHGFVVLQVSDKRWEAPLVIGPVRGIREVADAHLRVLEIDEPPRPGCHYTVATLTWARG